MTLCQAEALLGEDVVIGRATTWKMSTYLCRTAGGCNPEEYWAYAVWDPAKRDWIEPTLVFRRLSDLVAHCQSKASLDPPAPAGSSCSRPSAAR
jgi:hypothetical protein